MMNTRAIDEGLRRRKPDLRAYENVDNPRFQVCYIYSYVCVQRRVFNFTVARRD